MWKRRLGIYLAVLGGGAALVAPAARASEQGRDLEFGGPVSIVIGAGIWSLIGSGIGAFVDRQRHRATSPVSAASSVDPAHLAPSQAGRIRGEADPGWYSDPYGRFEGRYWSGSNWTSHVASGGRTYEDDPSPS
jgi:hypothetical protein